MLLVYHGSFGAKRSRYWVAGGLNSPCSPSPPIGEDGHDLDAWDAFSDELMLLLKPEKNGGKILYFRYFVAAITVKNGWNRICIFYVFVRPFVYGSDQQ